VSTQRLLRPGGIYYHRRRVPAHLAKILGKHVVQTSLHTASAKEAKKLRTLRDLEWDARFAAADASNPADQDICLGSGPTEPACPPKEHELLELVGGQRAPSTTSIATFWRCSNFGNPGAL
jgi:hypothetical protein